MDEYMGIVKLFAGTYAPQGWFFCQGQLLPISQYKALFARLGTAYGGDGKTTFALPNLMGNVPVGADPRDTNNYAVGESGGSALIRLSAQQMPLHTHIANIAVSSANATDSVAKTGENLGVPGSGEGRSFNATFGYVQGAANIQLASDSVTVGVVGDMSEVDVRQPYLALNYIICVNGI